MDVDSDHLDDDEEQEQGPAKKRKLSKKEEGKQKEKQKGRKKGKAKKDDDSDYEDSDDEYTALSKGAVFNKTTRGSAPSAQPPIGSFENCKKCGKPFTVVRISFENL